MKNQNNNDHVCEYVKSRNPLSNATIDLFEEITLEHEKLDSFRLAEVMPDLDERFEKSQRIKDYTAQVAAFGEIVDWLPRTDK